MNDLEKLALWEGTVKKIAELKEMELKLRTELANTFFPSPKEGTNSYKLENDYVLKGKYPYRYKLDSAALPSVLKQMEEGIVDRLINYTPTIVLKEYRALSAENRALIGEALTITPGTPQLEIVLSKRKN